MNRFLNIIESGYSINIKADYKNSLKMNSYIPVSKNLKLADRIMDDITSKNPSSYIISGAYGTGKSYFTAILAHILSEGFKSKDVELFIKKSKEKYSEIEERLKDMEEKDYLIVFPEDTISNFKESILAGIKKSLKNKGIEINLETEFDLILQKIDNWKENYTFFYNSFVHLIEDKKITVEEFLSGIKNQDKNYIEVFKGIYSKLFAGEKYSALDSQKNIQEILTDLEEKIISETNYRGVVYIFDEFGRYLESHIDEVDVKEVQDGAEYCNGDNSSALLLITHKDIFQYTGRLSSRDEVNEWEKVSGRFKKEHLSFEKTNVLEIVAHTLYKDEKEYDKYKDENKELFKKYTYFLKESNTIAKLPEELIDRYYPLNFLSANILPDLSQKIAQNERTLFAFLSGSESKALKSITDKGLDKVVSLDRLYDYFEDNFRFFSNDSIEYKTYLNAKNAMSKLDAVEDLREIKFIKCLALIYIYNKYSEIEPTREVMNLALLEDTEEIFKRLDSMNLVSFRRHYNHFKLVEDIDINVDKEVKKYMEEKLKKVDLSTSLNKNIPLKTFYPYEYNEECKITRYLGRYYLDMSENLSDKINSNIQEDGKIVYVSNLENREDYFDFVEKLKNKGFIVIYNKSNEKNEIYPLIRELEAINGLYKGNQSYQKDDIIKNEILSYKREVEEAIRTLLNKYFNYNSVKVSIPGEGNDYEIKNEYDLIGLTSVYLKKKYSKYIPVNYELINKTKLSVPMKKARGEILGKFIKDEFNKMTDEEVDNYFGGSGAENTLARILVKHNNFLSSENEVQFIDKDKKEFKKLYDEILAEFNSRVSFVDLLNKYCSNQGSYGFRRSVFMFIIALISIKHRDELNYSDSSGEEINFDLELIHKIEKNPKNYSVIYLKENRDKKIYLKALEELFKGSIAYSGGNKNFDIFNGMKSYTYNLPRIITQEYAKEHRSLKKLISSIMQEKNATEFLLTKLPKIYKTTSYDEVLKLLRV
jgi:hypothetical protein